jgi:basic membrane protein A
MKPLLRSLLVQAAWLVGLFSLLYGLAALGRQVDVKHSGAVKLRVALFINGTLHPADG